MVATMNDYRFDLAVLFQQDTPATSDILDVVIGFCDQVIRSTEKPDDLDYTASMLIAIIEKMKAPGGEIINV